MHFIRTFEQFYKFYHFIRTSCRRKSLVVFLFINQSKRFFLHFASSSENSALESLIEPQCCAKTEGLFAEDSNLVYLSSQEQHSALDDFSQPQDCAQTEDSQWQVSDLAMAFFGLCAGCSERKSGRCGVRGEGRGRGGRRPLRLDCTQRPEFGRFPAGTLFVYRLFVLSVFVWRSGKGRRKHNVWCGYTVRTPR